MQMPASEAATVPHPRFALPARLLHTSDNPSDCNAI